MFYKFPFSMNKNEVEDIFQAMAKHPDFQDIKTIVMYNGAKYLYSQNHMSKKNAETLAEFIENDD